MQALASTQNFKCSSCGLSLCQKREKEVEIQKQATFQILRNKK